MAESGKSGKSGKSGAPEGTPPPTVTSEATEEATGAATSSPPTAATASSPPASNPPAPAAEAKDAKDAKDPKDAKDGKEAKGGKDAKDGKDGKKEKPKVGADTVYTGDLLRQIRESQRISLKEIAERTRISVANLSALENEKYEDLPNARVYVRGFVRCLAVEIGLDRDQVSRTYLPRWEAWFSAHAERAR